MSDGRDTKHWSGTFQRLRAEITILAIVIIIASSHGLKLQRLPIVGIELDKQPSIDTVLLFLYAFFAYFLLAWVARYLTERAEQLLPIEKLTAFGDRMDETLHRLESKFPPDASIITNVTAEKVRAFHAIQNEWAEHFRKEFRVVDERLHGIADLARRGLPVEGYDIMLPLVERLEKIREANETPRGVAMAIEEAINQVQMVGDQLRTEIEEKGPAVSRAADDFRKDIEGIRREMRRAARAISWDREILGFYIPLLFALGAVLYSFF